jgi:acyl-coenzyme A thioesterase PaaI-like protein
VTDDSTLADEPIDPWEDRPLVEGLGGPRFGSLLAAFRRLQDAFVGACPSADDVPQLTARVEALADDLERWTAPERHTPAGTRLDLPGRGNPLLLPFEVDEWTTERVRGRVVFTRFHLGGNGAAHGGTIPLLFDEVLGRLANSGERRVARTAFLTVNYRSITRLGLEHRLEADLDRVEGRKRRLRGKLIAPDGTVTADAEGLFVELRPGQP